MKAVYFSGDKKVEQRDVPIPQIKKNEVLLKIENSAICGSDMKHYYADQACNIIQGHENQGIIEKSRSKKFKEGQRIITYALTTCNKCKFCLEGNRIFCDKLDYVINGFSEYIAVNEADCLLLPSSMNPATGAIFGDCIGLPYHTLKRLVSDKDQTIAILGLGPVGLGMVIMAKLLKLQVIGIEINNYRLDLAKKLGADYLINPQSDNDEDGVKKITDNYGPDIVIDCAGLPSTQIKSLSICKKGGKVAFVGGNTSLTLNPNEFFLGKELCVTGNWYYAINQYTRILEFTEDCTDFDRIVTHTFYLDQAQKAFDIFASRNSGKVILQP